MIELRPSIAIALLLLLGLMAQWFAWRIRIPAILPLLVAGFLVGPVFNLVDPSELIGDLFFPEVSLMVGLILFEGGLTLRLREIKQMRRVVLNLVTIGALITWLGSAAAAHLILGLDPLFALLFGALIIVTGPTVIGPLLRNVRPTANVANVLRWEGILIDPIGALVAVLIFEFLLLEGGSALNQTVLLFGKFILVGSLMGVLGGYLVALVLRRRLVPDFLVNVMALTLVFLTFSLSSALAHESGLLAAVVMGMILGNSGVPNIETLLSFKEDIAVLFISLLFVTLAAEVRLELLLATLDWRILGLLAVIMLVLRPLNIFISTLRSPLSFNEKLFLAWIAPRGIVAASVTSLFVFRLYDAGFGEVEVLSPLVFFVILGTVTLNSLTAKPLAKWLGVAEPDPQGLLILGAHPFARRLSAFLQHEGVDVVLADTNWAHVAAAHREGLNAYHGSPLSPRSDDELRLSGIGALLALTSNDEANALTALKYAREFGSDSVYQLEPSRSPGERERVTSEAHGRTAFGHGVSYMELNDLLARGASIEKFEITDESHLEALERHYGEGFVPMFTLKKGAIRILSDDSPTPELGSTLVALVLETKPDDVARGR
jgi:NhaP-type Na+/H+ or K+/H+ antiporter